ncbi:Protein of unknown function [Lactobacillus helveticus CIRM-BIA 953]|uniref:Uncharacterized protein n=1 Tax=Lactobacillus helveticus CIRM-BIA 953 TaxID=1226335 RepID=U4QBG9_LACHE|nr:Protein of unknown function [Lactobacillus helveticus CIRM-BIA 953]
MQYKKMRFTCDN